MLYVVWHPGYTEGAGIAESLREHFRRKLYENVAGGTGLSAIFRSAPRRRSAAPLPIDLEEAESTAIVLLVESTLAKEPAWLDYVHELVEHTEAAGLGTRVFPVALDGAAVNIGLEEQALRWDLWTGTAAIWAADFMFWESIYSAARTGGEPVRATCHNAPARARHDRLRQYQKTERHSALAGAFTHMALPA